MEQALHSFEFHVIWIKWIMAYVRCPSFAILINGIPSNFFQSAIKIRRGCLLSPYPFICCADILSRVLWGAASGSDLDPYVPTPGAQPIFHLLFANDCLLLRRASPRNAVTSKILEYYRASG